MQKVKITQPGFEGYNGIMCGARFKDGISIEPLRENQFAQIRAAMRAEQVGEIVEQKAEAPKADKAEVKADKAEVKVDKAEPKYSKEVLEAIADEKGIAGMRVVAKEFGVKDKSLEGLMSKILEAQGIE